MATRTDGILSETISATGATVDRVRCNGPFTASVTGTWTGTVVLRRSFDGGSTFRNVYSWTSNEDRNGEEVSKVPALYEFHFTRSSGDAVVLLHAGPAVGLAQ